MSAMLRLILSCVIWIGLVTQSPSALADIYVSRDSNGRLVYSDRKPANSSEQIRTEVRPAAAKPAPSNSTPERTLWEQADNARAERARIAEQERLAANEVRAKRCVAARQQNAVYAYDGRKCTYDANGGRACLSSAEIDVKRAEAKKHMAEFCDVQP